MAKCWCCICKKWPRTSTRLFFQCFKLKKQKDIITWVMQIDLILISMLTIFHLMLTNDYALLFIATGVYLYSTISYLIFNINQFENKAWLMCYFAIRSLYLVFQQLISVFFSLLVFLYIADVQAVVDEMDNHFARKGFKSFIAILWVD